MTLAQDALRCPTPLAHARFDTIVKQCYDRIFRYAYRLTGCYSGAEDLTQETFLRAYRAFDSYDPARPAAHWLARITHNLFVDGLRGRKRPQTIPLDTLADNGNRIGSAAARELPLPDHTYNPERRLLNGMLSEPVESALASLPEDYRNTLILCDIHELSYKDIARVYDCSLGTIRSRIHRGRRLMQKALAASAE